MKAGRELDALVAEKVMGWVLVEQAGDLYKDDDDGEPLRPIGHGGHWQDRFCPSTSISAAWEVVEKLKTEGHPVWICQIWPGQDDGNVASVFVEFKDRGESIIYDAQAPNVPHAICLAALKAVE